MPAVSVRASSGHWWSAARRASLERPRSGPSLRRMRASSRALASASIADPDRNGLRSSLLATVRSVVLANALEDLERGGRQRPFRQRARRGQFIALAIPVQARRSAWRPVPAHARRPGVRSPARRQGRAPRSQGDRRVVARVAAPPSVRPHRIRRLDRLARPRIWTRAPARAAGGSTVAPDRSSRCRYDCCAGVSASKPMSSSVMPLASGSRRATARDSSTHPCRSRHAAYSSRPARERGRFRRVARGE